MRVIYDTETFPNCFLLCAKEISSGVTWSFEISVRRNDSRAIVEWMKTVDEMVGFNNLGFDYPILHMLFNMGIATPKQLYLKAQAIIQSENKFDHMVYPSDRVVKQIDLFKIHHFDNHARATSLKALEFNMRMDNIHDLPFPVGTDLTVEQIVVLQDYCWHDVLATELFYHKSLEEINFRRQLTLTGDVMNHSDVKLGKAIFQHHLENSGVQCYEFTSGGRVPKQTPRETMALADCIPDYIKFDNPEFNKILDTFNNKVITETKGAFKNLTARINGMDYVFGTGGIHASIEQGHFIADDDMMILDIDVSSMYPSIAIANNYYPEHLGEQFVKVYDQLRTERMRHPKGSIQNAALKLALNGVYGASGDKFSIFYDPLFTMKITVGGQLMMAMLIEALTAIPAVQVIQANTDGVTLYMPRKGKFIVDMTCQMWEEMTKLQLEQVEYSKMFVADVNSYIAQTVDGKVKRKGRYEYELEWHQDASCLVVPKIAERVLLENANIDELLRTWPDPMDFMLRAKVPRTSRLMYLMEPFGEEQLENTQRYYMSVGGGELVKVMPPLAKKPNEWRKIGINKGYTVQPCNDVREQHLPINYDWYKGEIETLTYGVM